MIFIHSAKMARQGSRPQGIGYGDRKVLGARAIFVEVQCNFAELCKKKQDKQLDPMQGHRDKSQNPGRILLNQGQLASLLYTLDTQRDLQVKKGNPSSCTTIPSMQLTCTVCVPYDRAHNNILAQNVLVTPLLGVS